MVTNVLPDGSGGFALGNPDGKPLHDGDLVDVLLGGVHVRGWIEQRKHEPTRFVSEIDGSVVGLCAGMRLFCHQGER